MAESTLFGADLQPGFQGGDDRLLQITAVPEPETYAMMLAGLGLMGFVARRRKAVLRTAWVIGGIAFAIFVAFIGRAVLGA